MKKQLNKYHIKNCYIYQILYKKTGNSYYDLNYIDLVKTKRLYTEYIYFSEGIFFKNACPKIHLNGFTNHTRLAYKTR